MSTLKLHCYQIALVDELYKAWRNGVKNVLMQLPTGGGKSVILAHVIKNHVGKSVVIAHRGELVNQLCLALSRLAIPHDIIAAKATIKEVIAVQLSRYGRSYYQVGAKCAVASVDTLIKQDELRFKNISLLVQDEAHHVLAGNKWGAVTKFFPDAKGLYLTATPRRGDGKGLGRHAHGVVDVLIKGPSMRALIDAGYLSEYRIIAPRSDINLENVPLARSGDYNPEKLRAAVHKSYIVGDVVNNYIKFAQGKLGITFAVDVRHAEEIAARYNANGVAAKVISGKTQEIERARVMSLFRDRKIQQIVNVDILGEGVDVPAVEVVTFARPTQSFALYCQQFGRALRINPEAPNKKALIIDHVDNVKRLGLPDSPQIWSLDSKPSKSTPEITIKVKTCLNINCLLVYEAFRKKCPGCGESIVPISRSAPSEVEGDLSELSIEALEKLRSAVVRIDAPQTPPRHLNKIAQLSFIKKHNARCDAQKTLRSRIAQWAGYYKIKNFSDADMQRLFFYEFNIDVLTAQTLGKKDAEELKSRIDLKIISLSNGPLGYIFYPATSV